MSALRRLAALGLGLATTASVEGRAWADAPMPSSDDVTKTAGGIPGEPWMAPVEVDDATKADLGGYLFVPSVYMPVFVTDPFGLKNIGVADTIALGPAVQWRLGLIFGRLGADVNGGYLWTYAPAPVSLPDGSRPAVSGRAWQVGARVRYVLTTERTMHPFATLGGGLEVWSMSVAVRPDRTVSPVDAALTPAFTALLGSFARIGNPSGLFAEFGVQGELRPAGGVFSETQIAVGPFVGFTTVGVFGGLSDDRATAEGRYQ